MATFPGYVTLLFPGYGEEFDPSVQVTEMERGSPKKAVINSRVLIQIHVRLLFKSAADAASFETWYFDTIERVGEFEIEHPRLGGAVMASFQGGSIGRLVPLIPDFSWCARDVVLEYMR